MVSMKAVTLSALYISLFEYPFLFSAMVSTKGKPSLLHS